MWNAYLKYLRGGEVSRAAKINNLRVGATMVALTFGDEKHANMTTEQDMMPRWECFPPNEYNHSSELPPAGQAHQSITERTVKQAHLLESVGTAPAPDTLPLGAGDQL